jgi:hypothetical protein
MVVFLVLAAIPKLALACHGSFWFTKSFKFEKKKPHVFADA